MSNATTSPSRVAAAIGEPARARMLFCLMDGHARTSTELAVVGDVSPSTASVHLNRLKAERLVSVFAREAPLLQPGRSECGRCDRGAQRRRGPSARPVRADHAEPAAVARTCYDHMAGTVAVALHDRFRRSTGCPAARLPTTTTNSPRWIEGARSPLGIDVEATRRCAGGLRSLAWTGASGVRMSAVRSVRLS